MPLKNKLLKEIEKRKEIYAKSPDDMIAAYNREEETKKDYNGRQLLELLQNADDERSDVVQIELNTQTRTLTISNRGKGCRPFSFEGIKSLMISNLSSKVSKKYIGNKGLGFRSIINWSDKVVISSNGLDIEFSKDFVDEVYDGLFDNKQKTQFCERRKLSINVKPIPFLSIPKLSESVHSDWTTRICIEYKNEFLDDIREQISELKDEVLLFLNHLKKLTIIIDGNKQTDTAKKDLENKWSLYSLSDRLPKNLWDKENEEEWFDLKLALQDGLQCDVQELFAFFPTKIHPGFPFIIHGTFELDSSRNHLVKSDKNKFILSKLAELIISTAKTISESEVSYKALQMLQYDGKAPILEEQGLYASINDAIENLDIFPCVDQTYKQKKDVSYCDDLSRFITQTKTTETCGFLLIPNNGSINLRAYSIDTFVNEDTIDILSNLITDLDERCDLIHLVFENQNILSSSVKASQKKYSLLVDKDKDLIPLDDDIYTPTTQNMEYTLPHFVHIKFIHPGLFEKLIVKFNITSHEKARELQRELKQITNIHSYEPAQVLQKIVSSTNKELKNKSANKTEVINGMLDALYKNYQQQPDTKIPTGTKVQVFNKVGQLKAANDLFLSKSYPSGKLTEFLFGDIFQREDFLAGITSYDIFENQDIDSIERYFLWLGVNRHSKLVEVTNSDSFRRLLFAENGVPQGYRSFTSSSTVINNFSRISRKLSREKFVLWICKDPDIQNRRSLQHHTDTFRYSKNNEALNTYYYPLYGSHPHLVMDILSTKLFTDFLVKHDNLSALVNDTQFNFEDPMFENFGVLKSSIESLLTDLGAINKFSSLSITALRRIVRTLPQTSPTGKQAPTIYAHCIKHFETNGKALGVSDIKLFSQKNGKANYYPANEVYYNGSIKLPKNITKTKAILKYQRRQNTKNIIDFFGINDLETIDIKLLNRKQHESATSEFKEVFNKIKPYILANRINRIALEKDIRPQLQILNNIDIILCTHAQYKVDDKAYDLDDNDYIKNENEYLIKIPNGMSVSSLCQDFDFQECFADIIGLAFGIQETKTFRGMIKESTKYLDKTTRSDLGDDTLARANKLLNISDGFKAFWRTIYELKGKKYPENSDVTYEGIEADLELGSPIQRITYEELNTKYSCLFIKIIFTKLDISIEDFNAKDTSYYKIDFQNLHKFEFENEFHNQSLVFKRRAYSWCYANGKEGEFATYIDKYNHNTEAISALVKSVSDSINVEYRAKVKSHIETSFPIEGSVPTSVDIDVIRNKNIKKLESKGFKVDDIESNHKHMSFLYFEGKVDAILERLEKTKNSTNDNVKQNSAIIQNNNIKITAMTPQAPVENNDGSPKRRRAYKHRASDDKRKKTKGDESEQKAYHKLCEEFGKDNVEWVAQTDDSLGYDMKYKNKDAEWKYVEVKTYSGDKFYLTLNEKKYAQNHIGSYELFLVDKDQIYQIFNIDYNDETQFKLTADRFVIECVLATDCII